MSRIRQDSGRRIDWPAAAVEAAAELWNKPIDIMPQPPRLLPDEPLPTYRFVPGQTPRPVDERPESGGADVLLPEPPEGAGWAGCRPYLRGIDLFNHGYYWEAHEAWEAVWIAAGRTGRVADFLKALIKLAAAAVKACEGNPRGVRRHARRAAQLLAQTRGDNAVADRYLGLSLCELRRLAERWMTGQSSPTTAPPPLDDATLVCRRGDES